jgi:hypothetical protein
VSFTRENALESSFWGVIRGIGVQIVIYPLEVTKINCQCSEKSIRQVALALFQEGGLSRFYQGASPQMLKTCIKQIWSWPMITGVPPVLQGYGIEGLKQQALTGLLIATVDAAVLTPLEKMKSQLASQGGGEFCLKNGWQGFGPHFAKLSSNWVVFLVAQKYLRDQARAASGQPLSLSQKLKIGVEIALMASGVSAPFDFANTLKQVKNESSVHLFHRSTILKLYRGWPLSALGLITHGVASVILLEKLDSS